jgi:1,4-dihydroxy-2-naphthoate octaprenyltransferase
VATAAQWIQGARLRTLPAAIAPVLIGSAAAYEMGSFLLFNAILAALVALLLQVGVNFANDYSDGIRGTDDDRVGPLRLVGSGAASPEHVKRAAFGAFAAAMVFGLVLVGITQSWWLILVGLGCVMAAWGYTGGKNPYGYMGLGDVFVFVFFGLVATLGTTYTQAGQINLPAIIGAIGTGLIATALLMANNVRDIPTDMQAGKKTLAVRLGDKHARESYVLMLAVAILLVVILDADCAAADPGLPDARMADDQRAQAQEPHPGPQADRPDQPRLQPAVFTGTGTQPRFLATPP